MTIPKYTAAGSREAARFSRAYRLYDFVGYGMQTLNREYSREKSSVYFTLLFDIQHFVATRTDCGSDYEIERATTVSTPAARSQKTTALM